MKKQIAVFLALFSLISASTAFSKTFSGESSLLMENKGQVYDQFGKFHPEVSFLLQSPGMKVWFTPDAIHYQFEQFPETPSEKGTFEVETYRVDLKLVGGNPQAILEKGTQLPFSEHFYNLPSHPAGLLNVHAYESFRYKDVYPGIDWMITFANGELKFQFEVAPGADPNLIQLNYEGAEALQMADGAQAYRIACPMGTILESKPYFYSAKGGKLSQEYYSAFKQIGPQSIGFQIPQDYDRNAVLVLDPTIQWATYYGGTSNDRAYSTAINDSGQVYLGGYTTSSTQIAMGGHSNTLLGSNDAMLVKFDGAGTRLWATYYGGSGSDQGFQIGVFGPNSVFLTGITASSSLIASGGQQNTFGGSTDAFLVKFNGLGVRQWATYFGTALGENCLGFSIDTNGDMLICGSQGSDAYMTKYNAAGTLQWTHNYGGSGSEDGFSVAFDPSGNCYLAGSTSSSTGFATGGFQTVFGGGFNDGFFLKTNAAGTTQWISYYGNTGEDKGLSIVSDANGNIYLAGTTNSSSGIANTGHQMTLGGNLDGFLAKFDNNGSRLWSTYYGGGSAEGEIFVKCDYQQNIFLGGSSPSTTNIATAGSLRPTSGGSSDAFLAKFNPAGVRQWGTYYGGTANDYGLGAAFDNIGTILLCGYTRGTSNIAQSGHQNTYGGLDDGFLVKIFDGCLTPPTANCQNITVDVTSGPVTLNASQIDNGSVSGCGNGVNLSIPASTYNCGNVGVYTVVLTVTDAVTGTNATCNSTVTVLETIAPTALCQTINLYLDGSGQAVVIPGMVDNGSMDNCGIDTMYVDSTLFTCASLANISSSITDLFFSEYMEGTSNNKAVEIYNGTGASVDLGALGYSIRIYFNGSTSFTAFPLTGVVAPGDVFVFCHSTSFPATLAQADQTTNVAIWTGDDAVVLVKGTQILDIIGRIGEDPGSAWTGAGNKTINQTILRNTNITSGVFVNPASGFPTLATDWNNLPIDDVSNLGQHTANVVLPSLTLTVVDGSGNSSTCQANYTLADTSHPSIGCQPVTLYLNGSNQATLTPNMVSASISDNCGIASTTLSRTAFDCQDVSNGGTPISELFISEYMEGTNNNKCLEIYNGTANPVNLGANGYSIRIYFNGGTLFTSFPLTGIVAPGDVFVFCHSTAVPGALAQADQTTNLAVWTGDDAIALAKGSQLVDIFGRIGEDPGSGWSLGGVKTINQTLVRKPAVSQGITTNPSAGFPTLPTEWNQLPIDDISDLGQHTVLVPGVSASATLTVTDDNGNSSACTVNITVLDTMGNCRISAKMETNDPAPTEPEASAAVQDFSVQVYPNPFSDGVNFVMENPTGDAIEVMITDLTGRVVMIHRMEGMEGVQSWKWNPDAGVSAGLYLYRVQGQGQGQVQVGRIERMR